jgi:hypothetical protein
MIKYKNSSNASKVSTGNINNKLRILNRTDSKDCDHWLNYKLR